LNAELAESAKIAGTTRSSEHDRVAGGSRVDHSETGFLEFHHLVPYAAGLAPLPADGREKSSAGCHSALP